MLKNATATWQAYNTWGGYDLYNGPGGVGDYANRSLAVSLDRPYDANGAYMFLYHERKTIELAERSGRPLAYVSMGTLQNGVLRTFRMIAKACAGLDLQLVISLGGGQDPALLGDLPGDPIVVGYAPRSFFQTRFPAKS